MTSITLTQRCLQLDNSQITSILPLTAWERTRSRYQTETPDGVTVELRLPRGTVLQDGDLLQTAIADTLVQVIAKPEPVLEVTSETAIDLLRAAYHLGNRHIPVEITPDYLHLEVDPVLRTMLEQLGVNVREKIAPFQPEPGAYSAAH
ncbi:MAG: urease accessory protein UreE [Roseofilum sp. SBFL]|uniref:urease accessory protein UreE n=1 Tax=unclassified Roseofilum TaxID=2620099 RepID=UPI000E979B07|nr:MULTISPECIES: urease accessory protein UreE [unclassified Roseofilum]HBQ99802.1 urease accessory protein UreE [Cyanobacteria bacterium UBA11691]MBP0015564.1 urease accessory protein UreE [Roseofilum sp. SID3]MBP0022661.1 urease accessory protein UreE [Roseofilum sp. SID2]MBP0039221.1 urease accessory protein UreE [Roseofilum sp. SID1]MBP0042697.1 urease accessory protein UreE [Roseofilum sp. SBFL]